MPSLDTANKEFLQSIMSHGIINARQVKEVINDVMRRHKVQSDFASYMTSVVAAINTSLEPYDMQVLTFVRFVVSFWRCKKFAFGALLCSSGHG